MSSKGLFVALSLAITGCSQWGPSLRSASLVLKYNPYQTQAEVPLNSSDNINHLILKLSTVNGAEQPVMSAGTQVQKSIPKASLTAPVTFANLKTNTTYRVRAYAYATADESQLISTEDDQSYTDIPVEYDDRPAIASLKVKLKNSDFNGQGTGSISISNGTFTYADTEFSGILYSTAAFVGSGYADLVDGTGAEACFDYPCGLVADGSGNIYVADGANNAIRKITSAGVVTTLAGTRSAGIQDGTGYSARFDTPRGIAIHPITGDLYVADRSNNRVRKVTTAGVVTTVAGNGVAGGTDANGTSATFNGPGGIAIDLAGNVFVSEFYGNRIRKIAPNGDVTTLAGSGNGHHADGQGIAAEFDYPYGMAIDPSGNLYVVEHGAATIRKVTPTGAVSTIAGQAYSTGATDGIGTNARFNWPYGIARDAWGNLYVGDADNRRVRLIETNGRVTTLAGDGVSETLDGTGTAARMSDPRFVTVGPDGTVYVADGFRIRKMN